MNVVDLATQPESAREEAARLLVEDFDGPLGWPDMNSARVEVTRILGEGFARAMIDSQMLIGWVGGLPQYDGRVWELHPIVVHSRFRRQGIGRALVAAFELEAYKRGALTATLGTDDNTGMTSLAGVDLYRDLTRHLKEIRDLGRGHPFGFYLKIGYAITGVMPDANGPGRPDIYMSKRLRQPTS
jgi:aminoglycoside 6'-N-acetyltransferase I